MEFDSRFWIELIGYGGTAFTAASYAMRTIIPLRIAAILSSAFFVVYAIMINAMPMLITELIILPLNVWRLVQAIQLTREVERAVHGELTFSWLDPYGKRRRYDAGDTVFRAGDDAHDLMLIKSGKWRLEENGVTLSDGQLVGELGFLSPGNRRTMTLTCIEAGEMSVVPYAEIQQLYYQNPRFGFFLLRLVGERLFQNIERARREAAERAGPPAPAPV